jgi:2-hydroxy-3-oxopropionate reductase
VVGWNRSAGTREKAHAEGLTIADDLGDVGSTCAVVLTMLPDLPDVVPVLDGGLLSDASAVRTLVVMGTVSPVAVRALADARPDLRIVDAPVIGGTRGARAATLSIMVGGDPVDVQALAPLFAAMGTTVTHLGPLGAGSLAKACNQLVVATTLTGLAEAVLLGRRGRLDPEQLLDVLAGGLAASEVLDQKREALATGDHSGDGAARYLVKDLGFVAAAAQETGMCLPLSSVVSELFRDLTAAGLGDRDNSVILQWLDRVATD